MSKEIYQLLTKSGTAINKSLQKNKLLPLLAEPSIWKSHEPAGECNESISGRIGLARQFYSNLMANTEWMTKMSTCGITIEKFQAGEVLFQEVEKAQNQQKQRWAKSRKLPVDATRQQMFYRNSTSILLLSLASHLKMNHSTWKCWES
nr:hypothetical protein [uncultured Draconibacterium sp.]